MAAITAIWLMDSSLGDAIARIPWVIDGVHDREGRIFLLLREFEEEVEEDESEFLRLLLGWAWVIDGMNDLEWLAFELLLVISWHQMDLAKMLATIPFIEDGVVAKDLEAIELLSSVGVSDLELARRMATAPWVADGVSNSEFRFLGTFLNKSDGPLELVGFVLGLLPETSSYLPGNPENHRVDSLLNLAMKHPQALDQLASQAWFSDGLDEQESAFVVTLGDTADRSLKLYNDLLSNHFAQSKTVSLPLAGDVKIWVFQNAPFPKGEDLPAIVENTALVMEELMGVPFPTNEIILLVFIPVEPGSSSRGQYHGSHMILGRYRGEVGSIPHETAHYYFHSGPSWFIEGGAEFSVAYLNHRDGSQSLQERKVEVAREVQSRCSAFENIRHQDYFLAHRDIIGPVCHYPMGENFLLSVLETIGQEAMSAVLRELYLVDVRDFQRTTEKLIYDTFLKHTRPELHEQFRELYQRLHGGPYAFEIMEFVDDHGDDTTAPTQIVAGQAIQGMLDYMFDFDYFQFRANQGQKYRMHVEHESLGESSITLYGPDGTTPEDRGLKSRERVATGPQILWVAPTSDVYYFAVQNFGGESGTYTLTIAPIAPTADDHGDSVATATSIMLDRTVTGSIDDDFDLDYFTFHAEDGQSFHIEFSKGTLESFRFSQYMPDGVAPAMMDPDDIATILSRGGRVIEAVDLEQAIWRESLSFDWMAPNSGDYYLVVSDAHASIGTYSLTVTAIANG